MPVLRSLCNLVWELKYLVHNVATVADGRSQQASSAMSLVVTNISICREKERLIGASSKISPKPLQFSSSSSSKFLKWPKQHSYYYRSTISPSVR